MRTEHKEEADKCDETESKKHSRIKIYHKTSSKSFWTNDEESLWRDDQINPFIAILSLIRPN